MNEGDGVFDNVSPPGRAHACVENEEATSS